jgi:hypothetical protein
MGLLYLFQSTIISSPLRNNAENMISIQFMSRLRGYSLTHLIEWNFGSVINVFLQNPSSYTIANFPAIDAF